MLPSQALNGFDSISRPFSPVQGLARISSSNRAHHDLLVLSARRRPCARSWPVQFQTAWPPLQQSSSSPASSLPDCLGQALTGRTQLLICQAAAAQAADGCGPQRRDFAAVLQRWLKRLLLLLGFAASCAAIFAFSLPALLSSPAWRPRTLAVCNRFLPARVSIAEVACLPCC